MNKKLPRILWQRLIELARAPMHQRELQAEFIKRSNKKFAFRVVPLFRSLHFDFFPLKGEGRGDGGCKGENVTESVLPVITMEDHWHKKRLEIQAIRFW
jgi:hypothetical protein